MKLRRKGEQKKKNPRLWQKLLLDENRTMQEIYEKGAPAAVAAAGEGDAMEETRSDRNHKYKHVAGPILLAGI